jgi:hypothetical protein
MTHGSETRARTKHVTVRVTAEELAAVEEAAERAGLARGSYVRQVLLGAPAPRQVRRPPIERRELARLLGLFGNISSNINQIARGANTGDDVDPIDFTRAIDYLRDGSQAILKALGRT